MVFKIQSELSFFKCYNSLFFSFKEISFYEQFATILKIIIKYYKF